MKNIFFTVMIFFCGLSYSQDTDTSLNNQLKVSLGFHGADVAIELPIYKNLSIELASGLGGFNLATESVDGYEFSIDKGFAFFAKGELKYYISRERRASKGNDLSYNSGSYIAFQSKFNANNKFYGKVIINEFHFGQQLPLGNKFLFNYHVGLGHISNLDYSYNKVIPAFGVKFSYVFLEF